MRKEMQIGKEKDRDMAYNASFNLESSNRSTVPSAPPRQLISNEPYTEHDPPSYQNFAADAVHSPQTANQGYPEATEYPQRPRTRGTLTRSLAYAGASVGHFFGVHDDPMKRGWRRTGTVRYNTAYSPIPYQNETTPAQPVTEQAIPETEETIVRRGRVSSTLNRMRTMVRRKKPTRKQVMDSLPKFWPVITVLIALIEIGFFIAVTVTGGLAPIAIIPDVRQAQIVGFDNQTESVSRSVVPNFFIGPSSASLVHTGAMYAPCIRQNVEFQLLATKNILEESTLRCCVSSSTRQCGMLPQETCVGSRYNGGVLGGASRCLTELNETVDCTGGVTLHPCCIGLLGQCVITTEQNCTFQEGYWHPDKVLCSEVGTDCFNGVCEFTWIHRTIGEIPDQGLRFLSAIILYHGVVQLVLIGLFKFYTSWVIERRIGFLRFTSIYIISGVGGFLLSGIFDPTSVSVGGSGALFGLLGVLLVELLQGWKWAKRPWLELIKLVVFILFLLAVGTLPYIDNFSQIGGFIFGVLASFIFVPYITLGKWDRAVKLCLILTAFPIILTLFLFGFIVFYNLPVPEFCPECSYINCIPYTSTFCDDFITTILSIGS